MVNMAKYFFQFFYVKNIEYPDFDIKFAIQQKIHNTDSVQSRYDHETETSTNPPQAQSCYFYCIIIVKSFYIFSFFIFNFLIEIIFFKLLIIFKNQCHFFSKFCENYEFNIKIVVIYIFNLLRLKKMTT